MSLPSTPPAMGVASLIWKDVSQRYGTREDLQQALLQLEAELTKVTTLEHLLGALLTLERLVHDSITKEVREYDLDVPIQKQADRSAPLLAESHLLFSAYHRVISEPSVMDDIVKLLDGADKQIRPGDNPYARPDADVVEAPGDVHAACRAKAMEFADHVRRLVLLCFAVSSRTAAGVRLLKRFVDSRAIVEVRPVYKVFSGSSLVMTESPVREAFCKSDAPDADFETRIRKVSVPEPTADRLVSGLDAPVWLSKLSAGDLAYLSFDPGPGGLTVAAALQAVLAGSLSFDAGYRPFYTPPRIEVLHEIVHAIHNATGENHKTIELADEDKALWDDAEEAWTIAYDDIGENALAKDVGMPARHGHGGIYLSGLSHSSDFSLDTLKQLSRDTRKSSTCFLS